MTEGTVLAAAGGEKCVLPVGDGIFINAGVLHADWQASAVPCRLRSMVFHPRLVGGSADSVFWQKYLQPLLTDPTRPCAVLHREIPWQRQALEQWSRPTAPWSMRCRATSQGAGRSVGDDLAAGDPCAVRPAIPKKALRSADRIKQMLQYIQDHYAEDVSVDQIAASASISASECLRCFHDMIGTTPNQYLRDRRAQRAAELLCGTGLSVTEIAGQCGFQDGSYFARRSGRSTAAARQSIAERQEERERCSGKSPRVGLLTQWRGG